MIYIEVFLVYIINTIGAIFCHVNIINELFQFNPSITSGNQKWNGAAPIFINKEVFIIYTIYIFIWILYIEFIDIKIILNIRRVDARACVIKYFIAASEDIILLGWEIRGIIDNKLISNPIHIPIHE